MVRRRAPFPGHRGKSTRLRSISFPLRNVARVRGVSAHGRGQATSVLARNATQGREAALATRKRERAFSCGTSSALDYGIHAVASVSIAGRRTTGFHALL